MIKQRAPPPPPQPPPPTTTNTTTPTSPTPPPTTTTTTTTTPAAAAAAATTTNANASTTSTRNIMKTSRKQESKSGKGLKHFSMKVCEKVKSKGTTTYNEVADELVAEFSNDPTISRQSFEGSLSMGGDSEPFDQKNIRRRVYDALNVLMAINVISKEKKEIKWIGLPTNAAQECLNLEEDKRKLIEMIDEKRKQVRALLIQQIAYKKLVERNKASQQTLSPNAIIKLPFIIITTDMKTTIDCGISNDRSEYFFTLNNAFGLHDDVEVLKRIGLVGDHLQDLAEAKEILPKALHSEIDLWSIE